MIEAFKSTLEESLQADIILLLIDSSDPVDKIKIKYYSCMNVLQELNVNKEKIITVFSKIDKADFDDVTRTFNELKIEHPIILSPKSGYGINKLRKSISQKIANRLESDWKDAESILV
jgi:GTP-binding protein HflX